MKDGSMSDRKVLLRNARLVLPDRVVEGATLLADGGRIARVREREAGEDAGADESLELEGATVYPGFIDAHIHGALGVDANETDAEGLHKVARFLARNAVTAWLPTLVPDSEENYLRSVAAVEELIGAQDRREPAARSLGVHYEGPFVNEKQCGALRTQFFRSFARGDELESLPRLRATNAIHMMTLAPEIEGGEGLVKELVRQNWVVSIGHTRAGVDALERALAAGARHMTHFMNAMSPLHHRAPGPVAWGLLNDDVTCDVIADGVHLDPLALKLVLRCKTAGRVSLISDAVAPAGLGDGEYRVWGETISVTGGRTGNERGSIAGSVITMLDAARMMLSLGCAETEVARMAATNPARLLGLGDTQGSIEEGKRADLVALDVEGKVRLTIVGGRVAFKSG
jgi:N-acetylglucosamine-6-phosphate deacetylase